MPEHTEDKAPNKAVESSCSSANYNSIPENEKQDTVPESEAPPRHIDGWKWWLSVFCIGSSMFFYALDNAVVADIQPAIIESLGELEKLTWLSVAFLLGATATNMIWGNIYGQFNAKMIVGHALCGVAGAGLYVRVMTLLAMTTTLSERPLYVSGTGLTWGIGIVIGPVVGGGFSQSLLIGAVCAPVYLFLLPTKDPRPGVSLKERSRELDYVGAILQMGALTTFVLAISWGGVTYPWNSGQVIGCFVASGVLFIILGLQQVFLVSTTIKRLIIPVEFFGSRTVLILFSSTAAAGAAAFGPIYMLPLFFLFTRGDGPLDAGVRLLPFIILMVVTILTNGALLSKLGYYMPWYLVGGLLVVAGGALMYTVDLATPTSRTYGYTVLMGVVQAVIKPEGAPSAVGFIKLVSMSVPGASRSSPSLQETCQCHANLMAQVPEVKDAMQRKPRPQLDRIFKVTGNVLYACRDLVGCPTCQISYADLVCVMAVLQQTEACFEHIAREGLSTSAIRVSVGDYEVPIGNEIKLGHILVMHLVAQANCLLKLLRRRS
ncbi:major facilitator superfamily domain-containing protein [Aspergillus spinulosporus]